MQTQADQKTLRSLIITPQTQVAREYTIGSVDLNKKIATFRATLQDPRGEDRYAGKELCDILFKPVEGDLAGAKAETVIWSLDDAHRYLPFAALWDEKQHLMEKWSSSILIPEKTMSYRHPY